MNKNTQTVVVIKSDLSMTLLTHSGTYPIKGMFVYEPRSEKTGLRGFRPGPTQIRLYSYRRWLEA